MELTRLPEEVLARLPGGYEPRQGVRLVLPTDDGTRNSIVAVNSWMRDLDMYPGSLQSIVWFGEDGVGNFLGWDPGKDRAIL